MQVELWHHRCSISEDGMKSPTDAFLFFRLTLKDVQYIFFVFAFFGDFTRKSLSAGSTNYFKYLKNIHICDHAFYLDLF